MDIGKLDARYLRDVELAHLLSAMVAKGLVVTVVLDSCHSGGATRGTDAAVRGVSFIDSTPRFTTSLVAHQDDLAATWRKLTAGNTRSAHLGSGWLPNPKGYVLLAACRPSESAYEFAFDGIGRNGALTYWLLDTLQQLGSGLTYRRLHDRVVTKVHTAFSAQTPMLMGEAERTVFGAERSRPDFVVHVLQVEADGSTVRLGAGQAQGLR